jgi:hypothetical protein
MNPIIKHFWTPEELAQRQQKIEGWIRQRARALDPKRPHVADRLAEVARQQRAASATPPVGASA